MKCFLSLVIFCYSFSNFLYGEIYPLSQKPFLNEINSTDNFSRGTFLIIVANDSYETIIEGGFSTGGVEFNYKLFKQTQGYNVEIWNYEEEGYNKESLRLAIEDFYNNNSLLEYVLLVGDFDPDTELTHPSIDSFTISSYNEAQEDVTDHPYTYFESEPGEIGAGLYPKFFIGRWSISSNDELKVVIFKTIIYANQALFSEYGVRDTESLNRGLLVAGSYQTKDGDEVWPEAWPVTPRWTSIWLHDQLNTFGYSKVDTAFYHMGNMLTTNPLISNAFDDGIGIVNYRGWGNVQGWVKPEFQIDDINNLSDNFNLPIVFSFVCNTGDFGNDVEPSFGEALLRAGSQNSGGKGAVAMIGPSDLDTDTRFNNVLCGALWDGLLEGRTPELAQALQNAKQSVAYEFSGITENGGCPGCAEQSIPEFYYHVYGILGDPSLPVWLQSPKDLTIKDSNGNTLGTELEINENFIFISLFDESGIALHDAVGALIYNDEIIAKGLSNYSGEMLIDLSSLDIEVDAEMKLFFNKAQFNQKEVTVQFSSISDTSVPNSNYSYNQSTLENDYSVNEIDYNWIELNPEKGGSGENLYLTDDSIIENVSIGFNFNFYDKTYSSINVCSNGWAAFEESKIPYFENFSIPFPMGPSAMLAVFYDDLDDNGKESFIDNNNNSIYDEGDEFIADCGTINNPITPYICNDSNHNGQYDIGEPFNVFRFNGYDYFVVQWDEISNGEDDDKCETLGCVKESFQLILYNSGRIVFQYKEIHDIDDGRIGKNGNLSTIGIESPDQNKGVQYLFRGKFDNGTSLIDGGLNQKAIQFCGGNASLDACGICDSDPSNDCICTEQIDCSGVCGGSAIIDECGICGGIGIAEGDCDCEGSILDCANVCGGSAVVDCDGVCGGLDFSCEDEMNIKDNLIPQKLSLDSYPNPFNPNLNINFSINKMSKVLISIIDINGKKIDTIVNKNYQVGYYSINWDGNHLPSGVYFIVLDNSDRKLINKVLLLK